MPTTGAAFGPGPARPRVAVVTQGFFPAVGGAERYHWFTARALADVAEVEVFTSTDSLGTAGARGAEAEGRTPEGIKVHYLPWVPLATERFVSPVRMFLALRRFRPDLVWGNHPSASADVGAVYARVAGRPWVATYHADISRRSLGHRLYHAGESRLLRGAALVLVTSPSYARRLETRGIDPRRIVAVPTGPYIGNGTLPRVGASETGPVRGPGREHPFLFVGVLDAPHAYKRLDLLLEALARLAREGVEPYLEVVGDGSERPRYEAAARELGISERVTFRGRLDDDALAARLSAAWALVVPASTPTEGFSTAAIEAVTYGCPVVASDQVSAGLLLRDQGCALVYDPRDPAALSESLRTLWGHPELRAGLARAALGAAPRYAWAELLPRLLEPIERLIGVRQRAAGSTPSGRRAS